MEVELLAGERNSIVLHAHFNLKEFACRCKKHCGGFVVFEPKLINGLAKLREKLEILQSKGYVKDCRVIINSACRCYRHNKDKGGVEDSEHLFIGNLGAADISTFATGLPPLEVGLLAWGQPVAEITRKYPAVRLHTQINYLARCIDEFQRFGIYGKGIDVAGYHGKKNFVHLGIETKYILANHGYGQALTALPSRWGDWPDMVEFYLTHPEKYNPKT